VTEVGAVGVEHVMFQTQCFSKDSLNLKKIMLDDAIGQKPEIVFCLERFLLSKIVRRG